MKKNHLIFVAFLLYATVSTAQILPQTPWVWVKGDNTAEQPGVYGILNIANTNNKPGARSSATTWRDADGNFWLFGGLGNGASGSGYLNDLWKYSPLTNNWTWVRGDNLVDQLGIFSLLGIANPLNKPGASYRSMSWTDAEGKLWLFGGLGYGATDFGFLNILWRFDPSTHLWTWVNGTNAVNQTGVYGTKGVESSSNRPGARYGSITWTDMDGNLWLFGGFGYSNAANGILNDLWKFNTSSNKWTWVSGDQSINVRGVYGSKGVPAIANKPGGRYVTTGWADHLGNLWMFGGYGFDGSSPGSLNDLWKYNINDNAWTWVNGDNQRNQVGHYGTQGVYSANNKPGARYISCSWKYVNGEFLLFGGNGFDGQTQGYLNDLWKYDPTSNKWNWIKGDSTIGQLSVYGVQGFPDSANKSGAKTASASWTDGYGNLWLFGGYGFDGATEGNLNELWKISGFQSVLPVKLITFKGERQLSGINLEWISEQETYFSHFVIEKSYNGNDFFQIGIVKGEGTMGKHQYASSDAGTVTTSKVFYRLKLVDSNGQFKYSQILRFQTETGQSKTTLAPNPATDVISVTTTISRPGPVSIQVCDMRGSILDQRTVNGTNGQLSVTIDIHRLPAGTYSLVLKGEELISRSQFIKQ